MEVCVEGEGGACCGDVGGVPLPKSGVKKRRKALEAYTKAYTTRR